MELDAHLTDSGNFLAQSGPASLSSMSSHIIESKVPTGSLMQPSALATGGVKSLNSEILVEGCFAKDLAAKVQTNKCSSSDVVGPNLLHTWWALVQDQMSTLQREVNSLRSSISQVQVRQAALAQRQEEVQTEMGAETKAIFAQVTEEQRNRTKELQKEKEERSVECARIWNKLPELSGREEVQQMHTQLCATMREEAQAWQEAHSQHAKELHEALANDIKIETAQRTASIDKIVQEVSSLRLALDKEVHEQTSTKDELNLLSHKLSMTVESERQNSSSSNRKLQMQLAAVSGELESLVQGNKTVNAQIAEEHKKSASAFEGLRRDLLELQSDINKVRSEHESCHRQVHEQIGEERSSRVASGEYVGSQVQEVLRLLSEVSASQEASYNELSEQVVGNQKILKLSFENFRSELDEVRSLFETELRQQAIRERTAQEQVDAKLEELKGPVLSNLRGGLQEELAVERQLRAAASDNLGTRVDDVQSALGKVRADQAIGEAKLQDHFTKMVMHVQGELDEKCTAFHQSITETRAHREEMDKSLGNMVSDLVAEDQKQAQAVLARANQILEADETWRSSLQETLRQEMVSRAEFSHETTRLWDMVHVKDMESSMCTLPPSSGPSTMAPSSASPSTQQLQPARVVPHRASSVVRSVSAGPGLSRMCSPTPPRFAIVQGPLQGLGTPRGMQSPAMPGTGTGIPPMGVTVPLGRYPAKNNSMTPQSPP